VGTVPISVVLSVVHLTCYVAASGATVVPYATRRVTVPYSQSVGMTSLRHFKYGK
jgi:hypothetical protein